MILRKDIVKWMAWKKLHPLKTYLLWLFPGHFRKSANVLRCTRKPVGNVTGWRPQKNEKEKHCKWYIKRNQLKRKNVILQDHSWTKVFAPTEERSKEQSKVARRAVVLLLKLLPGSFTLKETMKLAGFFFFRTWIKTTVTSQYSYIVFHR